MTLVERPRPKPLPRRIIAETGMELLISWEGKHDGNPATPEWEPKLCPTGRWTVGWGHALTVDGRQLQGARDRDRAMRLYRQRWPAGITEADADALLERDLTQFSEAVDGSVIAPVNENQHAALTVFAYNIGAEGFRVSSSLRHLNRGDFRAAADAMLLWDKGRLKPGGPKVSIPGLLYRRHSERALFLGIVRTVGQVRQLVADLQTPGRRDVIVAKLKQE